VDIAAVAAAMMVHASNFGNRSAYVNCGCARGDVRRFVSER
jgi:hypothetical protein